MVVAFICVQCKCLYLSLYICACVLVIERNEYRLCSTTSLIYHAGATLYDAPSGHIIGQRVNQSFCTSLECASNKYILYLC